MSLIKHRYVNQVSKNKVSKKKTKVKTINKIAKPAKYLSDIIEKRYLFISIVLVLFFLIIGIKLFSLQFWKED